MRTPASARIPSYDVQSAAAAPPNIAGWQVDPKRAALLVHDMQEYFLDFFDPQVSRHVVGQVRALVRTARTAGIAVAYTAQPGSMSPTQRGLLAAFWGPGMSTSPEHRDIVAECRPEPDDIVEVKWRYSAFLGNRLQERLTEAGRDQVILCGVFASIGCLATAVDAYSRDLETFFVADAMADFSAEDHAYAASYAARRCAVVLTAADTVTAMTDIARVRDVCPPPFETA